MAEQPLENSTPNFILEPFSKGIQILETYGWFILLAIVVCVYIYHKYKPSYKKWSQRQEDLKQEEQAKKNPDRTYKIQISVEQARLKLQQQVIIDAEKRKQKLQEIEEQKRKEKIEEWEKHKQGKGYHSKSKPQDNNPQDEVTGRVKPKKKTTLRNQDYNPLTGSSGGSCSYRPGRRNVSGGG